MALWRMNMMWVINDVHLSADKCHHHLIDHHHRSIDSSQKNFGAPGQSEDQLGWPSAHSCQLTAGTDNRRQHLEAVDLRARRRLTQMMTATRTGPTLKAIVTPPTFLHVTQLQLYYIWLNVTSPLETTDLELGFLVDRSRPIWAKDLTGDMAVWCHRTVSYIAATGHAVTAPLGEDKSGDISTIWKTDSWILTGMVDGRWSSIGCRSGGSFFVQARLGDVLLEGLSLPPSPAVNLASKSTTSKIISLPGSSY